MSHSRGNTRPHTLPAPGAPSDRHRDGEHRYGSTRTGDSFKRNVELVKPRYVRSQAHGYLGRGAGCSWGPRDRLYGGYFRKALSCM